MTPPRYLHQHGASGVAHAPAAPPAAHLPLAAGESGCLELLADRLRQEPGVLAIEADFRSATLTVRYQPSRLTPDALNALADEVGALFAARVTECERRETLDACQECALRLGRLRPEAAAEFRAQASQGRV